MLDFNWTDNIVFVPNEEWDGDEIWDRITEAVIAQTGLYPMDKGSEPVVFLQDGVNYHFGLVSKEDYDEWVN